MDFEQLGIYRVLLIFYFFLKPRTLNMLYKLFTNIFQVLL